MSASDDTPAPVKKRRGRKPDVYDPKIAEKVKAAAAFGHSQHVIAKNVGTSHKTLTKLYRKELDSGLYDMILTVEAAHFESARKGNVVAQIHILECKGGWVNPNRMRSVNIDLPPQPQSQQANMNEDVTVEVRMKFDTELRGSDDAET